MPSQSAFCVARHLPAVVLVGLLSGCFNVHGPTYLDSDAFELSLRTGVYRIHPGDELEVRFFHTPERNVTLPVRPDGHISLPVVRDVRAAGRTADELADELMRGYSRELRDPEIAVVVRSFSAQQIHVGGSVEEPGVFPLLGPMTVLDSLFAAGGTQPKALLSEVVVLRPAPDDYYLVIPVDIEAVLDGTDVAQNIRLLPFDAIYVPNSPIGNVNDWVDLYIRRNIPINFGLRPDAAF